MKIIEKLRLYLVTDNDNCNGRSLIEIVAKAVQGGVTCVQLREKLLNTRDFLERCHALHAILSPLKIPLIINDRLDIALACNAGGIHVGQDDMPVQKIRQLAPTMIIGLSISSPQDAYNAANIDADYLAVSPVFASATKPDPKQPLGLTGITTIRKITDRPLVGIGGINCENAASVIKAGCDGIAVSSAICSASDPQQAARTLSNIVLQQVSI